MQLTLPGQSDPKFALLLKKLGKTTRKELIAQFSRWLVAAAVALLGFAAVGWWLVLKPVLIETFGGVPPGAVIAFNLNQGCPADGWKPFVDAYSRTIIGALRPIRPTTMRMRQEQS